MRRRESPNEFWERMRSGEARAGLAGEASPGMVREPERGEQAPPPPPAPDRGAPPTSPPPTSPPPTSEGHRPNAGAQPDSDDTSVSDLVKQLTDQTKTLVKQEMRLAQVELQEKGKRLGIGAGMFGAGGLVAFFGAATLIAAIVLLISTALAPWLSALIVAVVLLAVAGLAALKGKKEIEKATPPAPEQAVDTVKEDVQHVKERAKEGKQ